MDATESKPPASESTPPKLSRPNHRKVLKELLDTIQKQEEIMKHLNRDLEFFRYQFKEGLKYDNGDGCYLADADHGLIDMRAGGMDIGNGVICVRTAEYYIGYGIAMENFVVGFKKTQEQLEETWSTVHVVQKEMVDEYFHKASLTLPNWAEEGLEKARKVAAQERAPSTFTI